MGKFKTGGIEMTHKKNGHYVMILLMMTMGMSSSITSYEHTCSSCSNKKTNNKVEQNRNKTAHQIQDDIHALRLNVEDYGATKTTYNTLDRFQDEINNLCVSCPELQNKKCRDQQETLNWKLKSLRKLTERQAKKMEKNGKIKSPSHGGVGLLLAPALTVSAPLAIASARE